MCRGGWVGLPPGTKPSVSLSSLTPRGSGGPGRKKEET